MKFFLRKYVLVVYEYIIIFNVIEFFGYYYMSNFVWVVYSLYDVVCLFLQIVNKNVGIVYVLKIYC